jgi:glyoxylase-like metal-dependent hydrolase (beta-lactamase superfamily II)
MKQIYADLWQTTLEKRFGTLDSHAYFLRHGAGNALIYHSETRVDDAEIGKLGGVRYQYLSHSHEILPSLADSRAVLGAKLCGHRNMNPRFGGAGGLDVAFDTDDREQHAGLEVIFTPGHTDNNVCYRYASPHGRTYLFTGDAIYQDHGVWNWLIFERDGGRREDMKATLLRLRDLDVDVLICSVSVGPVQIQEVDRPGWQAIVDGLLARF